jgi:hypothetical protein
MLTRKPSPLVHAHGANPTHRTLYRVQFLNTPPTYESQGGQDPVLPLPVDELATRPILVLDLDETLVHSSLSEMTDFDRQVRPLRCEGRLYRH